MKKLIAIVLLALSNAVPVGAVTPNRQLLDQDWRFEITDNDMSGIDIDDSSWRTLSLPHDWSVEHDFDRDCPSGNDGGYLPTGTGWYRKTLSIPALDNRSRVLYLEGAYMNSEVYVNGQLAGGHPYGYTSYRVDMTPFLHEGDNLIAVKVDNSRQKNCRWYSGSGLYRHVWLEEYAPVHIQSGSVFVTTPVVGDNAAIVRVTLTVDTGNDNYKGSGTADVLATITRNGRYVAESKRQVELGGDTTRTVVMDIPVTKPERWSLDSPALYSLNVILRDGNKAIDEDYETFGIRTIEYSAKEGFKLNGKPILLSGACVHHDNGILGAASYDDAEYRKARLLKEAGFNAVRGSHNPVSPAFLDACDRIGLLVIDEAFDGWREKKNEYDYGELFDEWWRSDLTAMIKRDRNHPSIISWSIGNEILERKSPEAVSTASMLAWCCRWLDQGRPVTSALAAWDSDWEIYDPLAEQHDIVGYNYMIHKAEGDHERLPERVMWQTESYPRDAFANWEKVTDLSYVIGDFVWTGIDYIGESGIGRYYYEGDPEGEHYHGPMWPWHNSYCGDIDIIGHRKPISHYREMLYSDKPALYIAVKEPDGYHGKIKETSWSTAPVWESWNWKGHEGKPITVQVMSNYPAVALYLNDKLIGTRSTSRKEHFIAEFEIHYQPGTLRAEGLNSHGSKLAATTLATAGKPHAIRLTADKNVIDADPESLVYVTAEIVDAEGRVVPDANAYLSFSTEGEGTVIATGNGNPKEPDGYSRTYRNVWNGRALAVIKSTGTPGSIDITASTPALGMTTITITVE